MAGSTNCGLRAEINSFEPRRLQALLRREIPDGDPAVLFDRALSLLLEKVEKRPPGRRPPPARQRWNVTVARAVPQVSQPSTRLSRSEPGSTARSTKR
jgi:hypothetical protein